MGAFGTQTFALLPANQPRRTKPGPAYFSLGGGTGLRAACPAGGNKARIGAVAFIHRFGALLNPHVHFHCVVVDGVFEAATEACESVRFHETPALCSEQQADIQRNIRRRLLRALTRHGLLETDAAEEMAAWDHGGGFSLLLAPLELIERLAALIPPPRRHRHRYSGVLAPNAPLRAAVTALARVKDEVTLPSAMTDAVPAAEPCTTAQKQNSPDEVARCQPIARPRASSGRCSWRTSMKCCRWSARSAVERCESSPSSTTA